MSAVCPDILTGINGNVVCTNVRIARITNWEITASTGTTEFADSDSGGFTNRAPTRRDLTGTADFKFSDDFPQYDRLVEGECCDLVLFMTPLLFWDVPVALIISHSYTVNVEDAEVIEGSIEFGAVGAYFRPGEAGAFAHVLPAAPT